MALEAIVYPQQQEELFGVNNYIINYNYCGNESSSELTHPFLLETYWSTNNCDYHESNYNFNYDDNRNVVNNNDGLLSYDYLVHDNNNNPSSLLNNNYVDDDDHQHGEHEQEGEQVEVGAAKPKRRRARAKKNKEEVENQRMTHIAVERNRRKQMNDYLNVLRSLMPHSYVTRGDQASIVGGAINFVKELEQNLQCLSAKKQTNDSNNNNSNTTSSFTSSNLPFGEFFSFPQYSTTTTTTTSMGDEEQELKGVSHHLSGGDTVADVEVTMVERHALVKVRTKQPPKQLTKLVSGLQCLRLSILHLNVTKVDGVAFYSLSLKVEDESRLSSVDEIASAVYQLLSKIQEGPTF